MSSVSWKLFLALLLVQILLWMVIRSYFTFPREKAIGFLITSGLYEFFFQFIPYFIFAVIFMWKNHNAMITYQKSRSGMTPQTVPVVKICLLTFIVAQALIFTVFLKIWK